MEHDTATLSDAPAHCLLQQYMIHCLVHAMVSPYTKLEIPSFTYFKLRRVPNSEIQSQKAGHIPLGLLYHQLANVNLISNLECLCSPKQNMPKQVYFGKI